MDTTFSYKQEIYIKWYDIVSLVLWYS